MEQLQEELRRLVRALRKALTKSISKTSHEMGLSPAMLKGWLLNGKDASEVSVMKISDWVEKNKSILG